VLTFVPVTFIMKKTIAYLFPFLVLFTWSSSYAQKEMKEDYKKLKSRSSVRGASLLLDEANELKETNAKEALNKVQDALAMSIAEKDDFNEGRCYLLLGQINTNIQEWKLARENFSRAFEKLSVSYVSTSEYKQALVGLGNTQLELGSYEEALRNFQRALLLRISNNERSELQLQISEVYYRMGNYAEATKALDAIPVSKVANVSVETRVQNQRAKIYARTNEFEKTKETYSNSVNTMRSSSKPNVQEQKSFDDAKEEIADVLHEQKKYDDEIAIRQQAVEYNLDNKNLTAVTKDKLEISSTLFDKGEDAAALKELEETVSIADTIDQPKEQVRAYLALAEAYNKKGSKDKALKAYQKYSEAVTKSEEQNVIHMTDRSELIRKQKDIEELSKDVYIGQREETIAQQTLYKQQLIIYGLLLIIAIIVVTSYFIYKNARASKVANQLLALKSLRSQMNPHFIFNALNSVNHFIAQQDERTANKFLSEFSQLMRLVLENSQEDFISFYKEQEILSLYLKLEHYRFRDKFDYEINIDEAINAESIEVPPMLIQPYIENAVWHGLRYKEVKGKLILNILQEPGSLVVEIIDDGIGRKRSTALKTENQKKHNSTGLKNIEERLNIINKVYKSNYRVVIQDLDEGTGTHVRISLPLQNRINKL
jgi:tetratricopeptide (TPR) repeat protein